ncbi:MAG: hypothetical protein ACK5LS_00105 [Propioniciclava sp.]
MVIASAWALFGLFRRVTPAGLAVILTLSTPVTVTILLTETLGALSRYRPVWVTGTVLVLCVGVLATATVTRSWVAPGPALRAGVARLRSSGRVGVAAALLIAGVGMVTFLTGAATAPNNIDSLNYHLPKIMRWLQNGDLEPFATAYLPQLYLPAGAEMVQGTLFILTGTDHSMFLAQWAGLVLAVTAIVVSARNLGVGPAHALLGGAVFASAPLVVGEAATTQNDLLNAGLAVGVLACLTTPRDTIPRAGWTVAMLAAPVLAATAVAVKPTGAVFLIPLVLGEVVVLARARPRLIPTVAVVAVVAGLVLNAGWAGRNLRVFDTPAGPDLGLTVTGSHARAAVANAVKNLGYNLAVPAPEAVNEQIGSTLGGISEALTGLSPDDPAYSFGPYSVDSQRNEDRAANLGQLLVIVLAVVACGVVGPLRRRMGPLVLSLLTGCLLFSAVYTWLPWGGRLVLTPLGFGCILVGAAVGVIPRTSWRTTVAAVLLIVMGLQSLPWLVAQKWRPLVGVDSVLITGDAAELAASLPPEEAADWWAAMAFIDETALPGSVVAIAGPGAHDHEYLWWRYLGNRYRIIHVEVGNLSADLGAGPAPNLVVDRSGAFAEPGFSPHLFGSTTVLTE